MFEVLNINDFAEVNRGQKKKILQICDWALKISETKTTNSYVQYDAIISDQFEN